MPSIKLMNGIVQNIAFQDTLGFLSFMENIKILELIGKKG
jgi:hypothetical protein